MGAIRSLYRMIVGASLREPSERPLTREEREVLARHSPCSWYGCDYFVDPRSHRVSGYGLCATHLRQYEAVLRLGRSHPQYAERMAEFDRETSRGVKAHDDFLRSIGYL